MTVEYPGRKPLRSPALPDLFTSPQRSSALESELVPAKRTKFPDFPIVLWWSVLGLAVAILTASLIELLATVKPSAAVEGLSSAGIFSAVLIIVLVVVGIRWRSQLIYEFHDSALDRVASVVEHDQHWKVDENGEWVIHERQSEGEPSTMPQDASINQKLLTRTEILQEISDYQSALTRLGALTEAREVGALLRSLRHPELCDNNSVRRLLSGFR